MPVAVRLIEVLTLVTLLGILTGFSIFVVVLQRIVCLSLFVLGPATQLVGNILYASEKMLIGALMGILDVTNSLGNASGGGGGGGGGGNSSGSS